MRLPSLYIPHGGGPCFFMDPPPQAPGLWEPMRVFLETLLNAQGCAPRAILMVSAHWETQEPTLNVALQPGLLYDYYGFPPHTYSLSYPAPGAPGLGDVVASRLAAAGFFPRRDIDRGLDHGVFVPLMLIRPQADIPVLQLSILDDLDPERHLRMGAALSQLRDEGVLIIGSGMSFHNLRTFFSPASDPGAEAFDEWLDSALSDPSQREAALAGWSRAPGARASHPREEHLLPLMVCAGAAKGEPARRIFRDVLMGKPVSAFRFG